MKRRKILFIFLLYIALILVGGCTSEDDYKNLGSFTAPTTISGEGNSRLTLTITNHTNTFHVTTRGKKAALIMLLSTPRYNGMKAQRGDIIRDLDWKTEKNETITLSGFRTANYHISIIAKTEDEVRSGISEDTPWEMQVY